MYFFNKIRKNLSSNLSVMLLYIMFVKSTTRNHKTLIVVQKISSLFNAIVIMFNNKCEPGFMLVEELVVLSWRKSTIWKMWFEMAFVVFNEQIPYLYILLSSFGST